MHLGLIKEISVRRNGLSFRGFVRLVDCNGDGSRIDFIGPDEPLLCHIVDRARILAPDEIHQALSAVVFDGSNFLVHGMCQEVVQLLERGRQWSDLSELIHFPGVPEVLFPPIE